MKKKNGNFEIIVIVTIIVLALTYLLFKKTDRIHYKVPELKVLKTKDIEKVVITKSNGRVVLKKVGSDWLIGDEGYKTDSGKVNMLIKTVSELKLTTLVSKTENYYKYELDNKNKINVKVFGNGKIIREFDVGKVASTRDHTNVKLLDNKNVYHMRGSVKIVFNKSMDDFRDKKIFTVDRDQINKIAFHMNGKELLLNKTIIHAEKDKKSGKSKDTSSKVETEWTLNNKKVNNSKINSILSNVTSIECDKYDYENSDIFADKPLFTLKLYGNNENFIKVYNLKNKDDDSYPVVTSQSKYKFFIKKYKIDNFFNTLKEL